MTLCSKNQDGRKKTEGVEVGQKVFGRGLGSLQLYLQGDPTLPKHTS